MAVKPALTNHDSCDPPVRAGAVALQSTDVMSVMETVQCNNCGSYMYETYLVRRDLSLFIPGDFRLVRCLNCGLIYLNPRPSKQAISAFYTKDYDQYTPAVDDERPLVRLARRYGLRKRVKAIMRHVHGGRLLDVGCATGDFLMELMRWPGWEGFGLEPDAYATSYAAERLGLVVKQGTLETVSYPAEFFDVVTLWNVFEHLHDPLETLQMLNDLLKPGGLLVISTPRVDSLGAQLFGQYWIGYELPRHLHVFSYRTLTALLHQSGFTTLGLSCLYGGYAAAASSVRFWLRTKSISPRTRERLECVLFSYPLRILTAPWFTVMERCLGVCSIPTFFAAKAKKL